MTLIDRMNANFTSLVSLSEMEATFNFMTELNKRPVEEVRNEFKASE